LVFGGLLYLFCFFFFFFLMGNNSIEVWTVVQDFMTAIVVQNIQGRNRTEAITSVSTSILIVHDNGRTLQLPNVLKTSIFARRGRVIQNDIV